MEYSKFNYIYYNESLNSYLLYNFLRGSLLRLDEENKVKFDEILSRSDCENEKAILLKNGFLIDNTNEIEYLKTGNILSVANKDTLSIVIAPTMSCNFDCPYCLCLHHHSQSAGSLREAVSNSSVTISGPNEEPVSELVLSGY